MNAKLTRRKEFDLARFDLASLFDDGVQEVHATKVVKLARHTQEDTAAQKILRAGERADVGSYVYLTRKAA